MPRERLLKTVTELEDELKSLDSVDDETRRLLEEAAAEIQSALDADTPQTLAPHSLSERLTAAAQDFESSHPTLGGILSRIIDLLGQVGV